MNKTILVIFLYPYNGDSSAAKRTLGLLKGFVDKGLNVYLLTTEYKNTFVCSGKLDFIKNVRIISVEKKEKPTRSNKIGLKKRIKHFLFHAYIFFNLFEHTSRLAKKISANDLPFKYFDYIVSISDPKASHIVLINLLKEGIKANKIIEYWGDPLYGDITLKTIHGQTTIKKKERELLSPANSIFYTSPFTVAKEKKLYPEFASKMFYIPTPCIRDHKDIKTSSNNGSALRIGYFGDYYTKIRNIKPLYRAIAKSEADQMFLYIIGNSDMQLKKRKNIEVLPRGNFKDYEQNTDLFVCILNRRGSQIPGKIYYCASTFKPVLVIIDGDEQEKMEDFLQSFNRFFLCKNDEESIMNALVAISNDKRMWTPCKCLNESSIANNVLK